jgi:hypothetical protein
MTQPPKDYKDFSEAITLFREYFEINLERSSDFVHESVKKNISKSYNNDIKEFRKHSSVFMGVRNRLVASTMQMARFYVLTIPPAPDTDPTGLRGEVGISGELRPHLQKIFEREPPIALDFLPDATDSELLELVQLYSNLAWLFSTSWNYVRLKLEGLKENDWYKPFVRIQCAWEEDNFRKALGLPSILEAHHEWGAMAPILFSTFQFIVASGANEPYTCWLDSENKNASQ